MASRSPDSEKSPGPDSEKSKEGATKNPSLKTQLFVLIGALALVPLLLTNVFGYLTSRDDMLRLSLESLHSSATTAAVQTRIVVDELHQLVESIVAGNRHLMATTGVAAQRMAADELKGVSPLDRHLHAKAQQAEVAREYYVLSPAGVLLGTSRHGASDHGTLRPDDPCLHARTAPIYLDRSAARQTTVFVAADIIDRGERIGTLCGRFHPDFATRLDALVAHAPDATFRLIDSDGTLIASNADHGSAPPGDEPPIDRAGTWTGEIEHDDGSYLTATVPVPEMGWRIVAKLPERKALASLDRLAEDGAKLGAGFLLVVLLGMALSVRYTVGPLRELLTAASEVKDGNLERRVRADGPREIEELGRVFNEMAAAIAESHETLEERVHARTRELRQNQQFTEHLLNSMEENILVVDGQRRIVKANAAALETYGDGVPGRSCCDVFHDDNDGCETNCLISRLMKGDERIEGEIVHKAGGEPEIMELQGFKLDGEAGDARALLVTRSVTEDRHREASLVHQERMAAIGLLSAGIAHEVGNPLASIKAQVQLAQRREDPEYYAKVLNIVNEQVARIERLLSQVVSFARRREGTERVVPVNQVVRDALQLLQHDPRADKLYLEDDLAEDLPAVRVDEDGLLQVVLNLGLNALDATGARGRVEVSTQLENGFVVLRMSDDGPGIPENLRDQIFEPYVTTKPSGSGTGLGLFVSRRLVERMGGELVVEETSEEGTTFAVKIPRTDT